VPLTIVEPRPAAELINTNRYLVNHSTMPYRVPIHVMGGKPPFAFSIAGIDGAKITPQAPPHNPLMVSWAVVDIPAGAAGTYTVTVTDYDGTVETVAVPVRVDDSAFVFCAPGASGGDGTIGAPLGGFAELGFADHEDSTYADNIVVLREGVHSTVVSELSEGVRPVMHHNDHKPHSIIGYPGETADVDMTVAWFGWRHWKGPGGRGNHCLHNFGITGGAVGIVWNYSQPYTSVWKLRLWDIDQGMIPKNVPWSDNVGGIGFTSKSKHLYLGMADVAAWGFKPPNDINTGMGVWYGLHNFAIDYVHVRQGTGTKYSSTSLFFLKGSNFTGTLTSVDGWRGDMDCSRPCNSFDIWEEDRDPPLHGPTADRLRQHRYCRLGSEKAYSDASGTAWSYNPAYKCGGYRYVDRCTVQGNAGAMNIAQPPYRVIITDSVLLLNRDWRDWPLNPDVTLNRCVLNDLKDGDTWRSIVDEDTGQLLGAGRFTKGWEIG
jgi:hypothetical protein